MLDQLDDLVVRDRPVERDRVPVLLVLVVPGHDGRVGVPQHLGPFRVALEVDPRRLGVVRHEREHLPADLVDGRVRTERVRLLRAGLSRAERANAFPIHATIVRCAPQS